MPHFHSLLAREVQSCHNRETLPQELDMCHPSGSVRSLFLCGLLACIFPSALPAASPDPPSDEMARTERSFARTADREGLREAFLRFLHPESVVLRPAPTLALPRYSALPPAGNGTLRWNPSLADSSGDMGFTAGPYSYQPPSPEGAPVSTGHFFSVWVRDKGEWKVLLDAGVDGPAQDPMKQTECGPMPRASHPASGGAPPSLEEASRAYAAICLSRGTLQAWEECALSRAFLVRNGHPLLSGAEARSLLSREAPLQEEVIRSAISSSGDLGWTLGVARPGPSQPPAAHILRVWRRDGAIWKLAADLRLPSRP